ncbi:EpsG family protein [Aeromonas caviae]|uniref:EpsG family protein n=1 Tax=Aeromonas caviae TaxID=648 RepID=UPI00227FFC25|nr:EpsG family protein [Aeromonas caviae]MCY9809552.1 EpsG family protein [Aeromonas caviae]
MWSSILFYNGVILISLALLYVSVKVKGQHSSLFGFVGFFMLFLISAIRSGIGTDYTNYQIIFELIEVDRLDVTIEPFFYLINLVALKLDLSFEFVIAVSSFLFVYPVVKCCDKKVSIWICFYVLIYFYIASFNVVRQGISIAISSYALYRLCFFGDKRNFILLIAISSLFHFTSIIGLIVLLFRKVVFPVWMNLIFVGIFYFISLKILPLIFNSPLLLDSKYGYYASSRFTDGVELGSGAGFFLSILPYFFIIIFGKYIFDVAHTRNLAINASLMMILVKLLTLQVGIFSRVEYSFIFIFAVIFGELAVRYRKTYLHFSLFIYILLWSILQFEMLLNSGAHEVMPYQSLLGTL